MSSDNFMSSDNSIKINSRQNSSYQHQPKADVSIDVCGVTVVVGVALAAVVMFLVFAHTHAIHGRFNYSSFVPLGIGIAFGVAAITKSFFIIKDIDKKNKKAKIMKLVDDKQVN